MLWLLTLALLLKATINNCYYLVLYFIFTLFYIFYYNLLFIVVPFYAYSIFYIRELFTNVFYYLYVLLNIFLFFFLYPFIFIFYIKILKYINLKLHIIIFLFFIVLNNHVKTLLQTTFKHELNTYNKWNIKKNEYVFFVILLGFFNYYVKQYKVNITLNNYIYGYFNKQIIKQYIFFYFFFNFNYLKCIWLTICNWAFYVHLNLHKKVMKWIAFLKNQKYIRYWFLYKLEPRFESFTVQYYQKLLLFKLYIIINSATQHSLKKRFLKKRLNIFFIKSKILLIKFTIIVKNKIYYYYSLLLYYFCNYLVDPVLFVFFNYKGFIIINYYFFFVNFLKHFCFYLVVYTLKFYLKLVIGCCLVALLCIWCYLLIDTFFLYNTFIKLLALSILLNYYLVTCNTLFSLIVLS